MAAVRGADTRPELIIRRGLHARGYRFRLHVRSLPGSPDVVLPRFRAAVFVNGCFWHGHQCRLFRWPATREDFWRAKIGANTSRDARNYALLKDAGWRVGIVWECALKGKERQAPEAVIDTLAGWLSSAEREFELAGQPAGA